MSVKMVTDRLSGTTSLSCRSRCSCITKHWSLTLESLGHRRTQKRCKKDAVHGEVLNEEASFTRACRTHRICREADGKRERGESDAESCCSNRSSSAVRGCGNCCSQNGNRCWIALVVAAILFISPKAKRLIGAIFRVPANQPGKAALRMTYVAVCGAVMTLAGTIVIFGSDHSGVLAEKQIPKTYAQLRVEERVSFLTNDAKDALSEGRLDEAIEYLTEADRRSAQRTVMTRTH